jgi:predicted RNA-binding protein with PIN domain
MSVKQLDNELEKINESIEREEKKLSEYAQSEHFFIRLSPSILNTLINARQGLMKLRAEKIGKQRTLIK